MSKMTATNLWDILESLGFNPRTYSGRYMYGKSCVGVILSDLGSLFKLGFDFALENESLFPGKPSIDNMGREYIVYWDNILITEEEFNLLKDREYNEDE